MLGLLGALLLPQIPLAQTVEDATALVVDCGPRDGDYFVSAQEDVGASDASWVPIDGSSRSTGWSHAGAQFIEYRVSSGLRPGPYEVHARVCVQQRMKLSASLEIDGQGAAGPEVFESPDGSGYTAFSLTARHTVDQLPLTLRLGADQLPEGDRIRAIRIEFVSLDRLTADGNVARVAEATVSSQLSAEYPIRALTDGETTYRGTTRGRSFASEEQPGEHWIEFAFARRESVDRVSIWWPKYPDVYNSARELLVQIPDEDAWRTVGSVNTPVPLPRSQAQFGPVETDRLRLTMPSEAGPFHRPNILWVNEVQILRAGTPPGPSPRGRTKLTWRRAEGPDWPEPLSGGEVAAEALIFLADSDALGPPVIRGCRPAVPDAYDWWWDGSRLDQAIPEAGRIHRLAFAPKAPNAPPVETLTLLVPGRCELVRHDDVRALPSPYRATPEMTDAEFFAALDLTREDMREVALAVDSGDWEAARQAFVGHVLSRSSPPPPRVSQPTIARPDDEPPDQEAERFLNHEWYFYKHRQWRPLGDVINWYLPDGDGSDRHYIARLDLAGFMIDRWEREGDDKWLRGYLDIVRQFYTNARPPTDPPVFPSSHLPWCGLCSAIRIRNVVEDYFRIADSPLLTVDDHLLVYKMALEHARFLRECDDDRFFAANHQMGHLVVLEIITATFPEFREVSEWRPYLASFLPEHLARDTLPDGGSVDTATGYGIWVATGLFTDAYLYADDAGIDLGDEWRQRLEAMYEWCLKVGSPDGGHLAIGDANYRIESGNYRCGSARVGFRGALLFGRPDFLWFADKPGAARSSGAARSAAARELFGDGANQALRRVARVAAQPPAFLSAHLPDTGWTIMRSDWSPEAVYAFINHHRGGHTHKTQNDINIVAYGRPFITDPGIPHTYATDRWQGWYVTTRAHNTVLVDGQDMDMGHGDRGTFFTSPAADFVRVTHDRYSKLGVSAHQRSVLFIKDDLFVIDDHLDGEGDHEFSWLARFQPLALVVDPASGTIRTTDPGPGLTLAAANAGELQFQQATGWMNVPSTAVCEEVSDAPTIALTKAATVPTGFGVALGVAPEGAPDVTISAHDTDVATGSAYHVTWRGGEGDVCFAHGDPAERPYGPLATDAMAAGRIERADGTPLLYLVGGTRLRVDDIDIELLGGVGSASLALRDGHLEVHTDGDGGAIRTEGIGIVVATLNAQPATLRRDGDVVTVTK